MRAFVFLLVPFTPIVAAQDIPARHNFEFGAAGLFPLSGDRTVGYSPGPGYHGVYEFRLVQHLAADTGIAQTWPVATYNCGRFGCEYSRQRLGLLDYGARGVLPLAGGRVELSVGLGGAYVWHPQAESGPFGPNGALFQYSGKAAFALDERRRFRLTATIRTYRDLGRPTQQWLTTTVGLGYGLGRIH
jgi:hypothetical protein